MLLFRGGPNAETNFALAELLYRVGDLPAARERYACALEIDEHYVEARANLGCVFAELGQVDLAVAAFRGTLAHHSDYADAHYHLAQLLDKLGEEAEAIVHWRRFLELTPESPWAETARGRLGEFE
jgi:tetratricopeptide (TPR) repeat protein